MSFPAMCSAVNANGPEEDCKTEGTPKKTLKKQSELPVENTTAGETPLKKKKKKKRQLTDAADTPGNSWWSLSA